MKKNKYLYNKSSLLIEDLGLNLYWTPNRFYDPTIGRFNGIDKVADLFTSVSPMIFGFNNPLKFVDPTGLFGDLPEFTVTSTRLPSVSMQYSMLLAQLKTSRSPIYRNLGFVASREGIEAANDLANRGRMISYNLYEATQYQDSEFMQGIRAMYKYGVTGSILAVAGGPILLEGVIQSIANGTGLNMVLEASWQVGNSLLYNGNLSQIDLADIGFAGFGKYGFVGMALVDFTTSGEFSTIGYNKNTIQFGTDLLIGGYNKWHGDAMRVSGVEMSVINFYNNFNNNLRSTVGTGIKEGVKNE